MDSKERKFRHTFAPDVVITDKSEQVEAVLNLKGRSQKNTDLIPTNSIFQQIELMKYHVQHEVPVAMINIKHMKGRVKYEWLVIGRAGTPPPAWMVDLVEKCDPHLPRVARSTKFVREVYREIKQSNLSSIEWGKPLSIDFQNDLQDAQQTFRNLGFNKNEILSNNVETYWEHLWETAVDEGLTHSEGLTYSEFYEKWKSMITDDYTKNLMEWNIRHKTIGLDGK